MLPRKYIERDVSTKFHFVEDYEAHVAALMAAHPIDEAMSLAVGGAVGGHYELFGNLEARILVDLGFRDGMALIDLGCGSGRLASAFAKTHESIDYLGTDVVQSLLDYAATKTPPHFKFVKHRKLSIPSADSSADFVVAFSLFTHLLHQETYLYLEEAMRVLKPSGLLVFSFLEFAEPHHWTPFEQSIDFKRKNARKPLTMFIDRSAINCWAGHLGFKPERHLSALTPSPNEGRLPGQSVMVLRKPV